MTKAMTAFPEDELQLALAPRRPDPAACALRVREKLARAGNRSPRPTPARSWSLDGWTRAAAALLPAGVSPAAFAGGAAKQAASKGVLGKALGLSLLPLFALGFAIAGFTSAITRTNNLRGDRSRVDGDQEGKRALGAWLREHWLAATCSVLFFAGLMWFSPLDGAVFGVAAMMISTATVARRLSASGLADRGSLGAHIVAVATQLAMVLGFAARRCDQPAHAALLELSAALLFAGTLIAISPFHPRRLFDRDQPLTPDLRRKDAIAWTLLAGCWALLLIVSDPLDQAASIQDLAELHPLELRLPAATLLSVILSAVLMARAPAPRPRGKHRTKR